MNPSPISNFIFIPLLQVLIFQVPVPSALPCSPLAVFVVFGSIRRLVRDLPVIFFKSNLHAVSSFPLSSSLVGSGYWPVPFSSDEALQIAGLFHQGQFPYCSGYEARRVQHFPDFNLESIFITKNIFIMKNPTDFGKTVENGVDPCLPNSRAQFSSWRISNN